MPAATDFSGRLSDLTIDATAFADERLARIAKAFAEIDAAVEEMRNNGIRVTPRYPFGVNAPPSATRFALELHRHIGSVR